MHTLRSPRFWIELAGKLLFAVLSLAIASYAFALLYAEFNGRDPFRVAFAQAGPAVPGHFFYGGLALALAPLQLSSVLRRKWPVVHRMAGWLYVLAVCIAAVSAFKLATHSQGGWPTGINFMLLAILWAGCTVAGVVYAIRRRFEDHRRWMLRSVALTFSAVTLRLYLKAGLSVFHLGFPTSYLLAAWLCWTINLALVEWYLRRRPAQRPTARGIHSASVPAGA